MVFSQGALAVFQGPLEQVNGLIGPARRLVGAGEVVARGQGAGVIGPQDVLVGGQNLLEQEDGLVESARGLVGNGEVAPRGQGAGVVGPQGLIEEVHGVGQGHGGLRTPQLRRMPQGVCEGIRSAGAGEQTLGVVLSGRRAQLLHEIEGLATTATTVRNWDGGGVHRPQKFGGLLLNPPPALGLGPPFLPDHAALKPVNHHFRAVLRELADRELDELAQRLTGVIGPPVQRLQPARGDARGREHGEVSELGAGDRLPMGALILDPLERALKRQPQGDADGLGVLIPLPAPDALLQCGPLEHA